MWKVFVSANKSTVGVSKSKLWIVGSDETIVK